LRIIGHHDPSYTRPANSTLLYTYKILTFCGKRWLYETQTGNADRRDINGWAEEGLVMAV